MPLDSNIVFTTMHHLLARFAACCPKGSDRNAYIQKTYQRLGGIYYAYPVPENNLFAAAPQGYELVYLSHYGRHGSRWMTSDKRYEWLWQQFEDEKLLTRRGRSVRSRLKRSATTHGAMADSSRPWE